MNEWRETAKNPPTEKDAGDNGIFVLSVYFSEGMNKWCVFQQSWKLVAALPDNYPFWMPMPDLPGMLDFVNKGLNA